MSATKEAPQTHKRRVAVLSAAYYDVTTDPAGDKIVVVRTADQGQEIDLTEAEEKRLDALGALDPPGKTAQESQAEADARLDDYRAARGDKSALERAMARAISPTDNTTEYPDPPESVSPPGVGAAPRGTYTQGDRGGPDVQPRGDIAPPAGGIVRADAPSPAVATPAELAEWIADESPTVDETVALAEGDPELAAKVLEAENLATGHSPRKGVESALTKLTEE